MPHDRESAKASVPDAWLGELERLPRRECVRLLRTRTLGRVGFKFAQRPVILPVNYRVIADRIVFRTAPGTKLSAAVMRSDVAFEVDDAEADGNSGWSVLVVGHATELRDDRSLGEARRLKVSPWAPGEHRHFVAVPLDAVSGRRFMRP